MQHCLRSCSISRVSESDAGYYNCTAFNEYGSREVYIRLAVRPVTSKSISILPVGECAHLSDRVFAVCTVNQSGFPHTRLTCYYTHINMSILQVEAEAVSTTGACIDRCLH